MSEPDRPWWKPALPYLVVAGLVLVLCTGAALADLRVLLQTSPTSTPCSTYAAAPTPGWFRLENCEAHLLDAVMHSDQTTWVSDLAHGRFPRTQRFLYVPVWGQGEPPPLRLGVLVEATDFITLHTMDGLRDRRKALQTLQGRELDMALAKLRTPEGVATVIDADEAAAFNEAVGLHVEEGAVILHLGAKPEASTFSRLLIFFGVVALLVAFFAGRRAMRHDERPLRHDPALEFGQLAALREEDSKQPPEA